MAWQSGTGLAEPASQEPLCDENTSAADVTSEVVQLRRGRGESVLVRAVVHVDRFAATPVAGIPVLARAIVSLWNARVDTFTLIREQGSVEDFAAAQAEIARVAPEAHLAWIQPGEADPYGSPAGRVVVADARTIIKPSLLAKAIERGRTTNIELLFPETKEPVLRVLSADTLEASMRGDFVPTEQIRGKTNERYSILQAPDIRGAERTLFSWCVKETDGIVSRWLNCPISTTISRYLSRFRIRPIQLTAVTALLALTTFALLVTGSYPPIVIGCVMYHVTSVVDGLDGELARAKYMSTPRGAALDTAVDMASNLLFMLGISIGDTRLYGVSYVWVGAYVAATALLAMAIMAVTLHFGPGGGSFDVLQMTVKQRLKSYPRLKRVFAFVNSGFKRDLFALWFAILGVTGNARLIPWFLAFGTTGWLLTVIVNVPAMLTSNRDTVLPPHLNGFSRVPAEAKISTRGGG